MIKKIFSSKLTSTVSGEFAVIGLKLVDTEAHYLRYAGTILAVASIALLFAGLAVHAKKDSATKVPARRSHRNNRRSRASHAY